jgi:hypothetical protein
MQRARVALRQTRVICLAREELEKLCSFTRQSSLHSGMITL